MTELSAVVSLMQLAGIVGTDGCYSINERHPSLSLSLLKLIYMQWQNDPSNRLSSQRHIRRFANLTLSQSTHHSTCCLSRSAYVHPSSADTPCVARACLDIDGQLVGGED